MVQVVGAARNQEEERLWAGFMGPARAEVELKLSLKRGWCQWTEKSEDVFP